MAWKRRSAAIAAAFTLSLAIGPQGVAGESLAANPQRGPSFGAIAVSGGRDGGFYWGTSHDYSTRDAAMERALEECHGHARRCRIVLEFVGRGCASYSATSGRRDAAFGWATKATLAEARRTARHECASEAGRGQCTHSAYTCNENGRRDIERLE